MTAEKTLPRVSIVIPTYNGGKFLGQTIQSCLDQTYPELEIIISDDGSKDDTVSIIRGFVEAYPAIRFLDQLENMGFARNVNRLVTASTGAFIIILGHDDVLPPQHAEKMVKHFCADVGLVHCNALLIDAEGREIRFSGNNAKKLKQSRNPLRYFCSNNFIQSCGLMFRKSAWNDIGGWSTEFLHFGEYESYIRYAEKYKIAYATDTYGYYRVHNTNISKDLTTKYSKTFDEYIKSCRARAFKSACLGPLDVLRIKFKEIRRNIKKYIRACRP